MHTWKYTAERGQNNATNVTLHPHRKLVEGHILLHIEKSTKCNQCEYASTKKGSLKIHENICINANIVILHYLVQFLWGRFWKRIVGKRQITSTSMHHIRQETWGSIWKRTVEESKTNANKYFEDTVKWSLTNAINVTFHLLGQPI